MVYFKKVNSFLVWDAPLLVTIGSGHCFDMIFGKIENDLERGFVKHRLNCLLITDPYDFSKVIDMQMMNQVLNGTHFPLIIFIVNLVHVHPKYVLVLEFT